MKRKGVIITAAILIILLSGICIIIATRNSKLSCYEYPIVDSMDAKQILNACRIPEKTLNRMTDDALAQAVADFPLLIDVTLASSIKDGVECLADESDAYAELLTRAEAKNVLIEKMKELYESEDTQEYMKAVILRDVILNESSFQDKLTEEEIAYLNSVN